MRRIALFLLSTSILFAQTFDGIQVERVSPGREAAQFGYLDGITWVKDGYLLVADVVAKKLFRFDPGQPPKSVRDDNGGVQGISSDSQGRIYLCEGTARRVTRLDRKGKVDVLADQFQGKKLNAPNDIVVRKDGQIYFTDPAFGSAQDHRDLDFFGIFHINLKGEVEAVAKWKTRPNGVALNQDGKILYVTDSDRHMVVAFDLDKAGTAGNERTFVKGIPGVPGGIRTDVQGRLYVAAMNVEVYSSSGQPVHTIQLSEPVTNCAFGDEGLDALYIATRKALYRAQLNVKGASQ